MKPRSSETKIATCVRTHNRVKYARPLCPQTSPGAGGTADIKVSLPRALTGHAPLQTGRFYGQPRSTCSVPLALRTAQAAAGGERPTRAPTGRGRRCVASTPPPTGPTPRQPGRDFDLLCLVTVRHIVHVHVHLVFHEQRPPTMTWRCGAHG